MARRLITTEQRRARLGQRHRLTATERTNDVAQIADDLVALHATDPATVYLSAAIRMRDASITTIDQALYADRTVVRHHAMRRTMWVATPQLTQATNAACTRKLAVRERKQLLKYLAQTDGITDPEATLIAATERFLELIVDQGPMSTRQVGIVAPDLTFKVVAGSGKFTAEVGAHTRIGALAAFEAKLVRTQPGGSWVSAEYAWELMDRWTDIDFSEPTTSDAMATLVRTWLDRFGPGTERDLAWWTGSTKTSVRNALQQIEAVEVDLDNDMIGWVNADDPALTGDAGSPHPNEEPWIALVPSLDPTVMGWKDRAWYLDDAHAARVFDRNGNAGPTIWADGKVVGGWIQRPDGSLALDILEPLSSSQKAALDVEVDRLCDVIGDTRFRVRFPSPNQKELLS